MRRNAIWALCALLLAITACSTKEKDAPIVIEKIAIIELSEKSPVKILEGESKDVTVSGQYVEKIEVTSSDTNVVTVSTNDKTFTINAKAVGTATVTVTSGKATKALSVEVSSKNVPVSRIVFDEQVKFQMGRGHELRYTVYPENATNKQLTWTSSNPQVVRVDKNGSIYVLRKPNETAIITATATDGSGVSAQIEITAVNPVKELRILLGSSHLMGVDSKFILEYEAVGSDESIEPSDKSVLWKSSAPEIVSVAANGQIHCLKEGEAVITATANDGFGAEANIHIRSINPVNNIKVNGIANNGAISIKKNTSLDLTVTTFNGEELVETITKGKSKSPYVRIFFSTRSESVSYMAEVSKEGLLKVYKTGTFTLKALYQNTLNQDGDTGCEITVTVTD